MSLSYTAKVKIVLSMVRLLGKSVLCKVQFVVYTVLLYFFVYNQQIVVALFYQAD